MNAAHEHDKLGIACNHVVRRKRPVMIVVQDKGGLWQFMCGKDDHAKAKQAKKVCSLCTFDAFAPGLSPQDVPPGHIAERRSKTVWDVREMTAEEVGQIEA